MGRSRKRRCSGSGILSRNSRETMATFCATCRRRHIWYSRLQPPCRSPKKLAARRRLSRGQDHHGPANQPRGHPHHSRPSILFQVAPLRRIPGVIQPSPSRRAVLHESNRAQETQKGRRHSSWPPIQTTQNTTPSPVSEPVLARSPLCHSPRYLAA